MSDGDLAWRVEEACLAACPSPREVLLNDRWLVRIAGGATRRLNAVNPLRAAAYDPGPVMASARRLYLRHGQPLLFRAPSIARGLDTHLENAGLVASGTVSTLVGPLDEAAIDTNVTLASEPDDAWLAAKFAMTPKVGARPQAYRAMVDAILLPTAFAAVREEGRIVGVGYGAVHEGLLVLESIVIGPEARRRGCGRRLVAGLIAWARESGAETVCLQVESDNAPALALYRSLGLRDELYLYRYFRDSDRGRERHFRGTPSLRPGRADLPDPTRQSREDAVTVHYRPQQVSLKGTCTSLSIRLAGARARTSRARRRRDAVAPFSRQGPRERGDSRDS